MRASITGFILWVLLPVALGGFAGHLLTQREGRILHQESTARMGRTGSALLAGEMSLRTEALALEAPVVPNPDPDSPLIRAALAGDTVAALGSASDGVTLSLALAEAHGDSVRIRASTIPFSAESLQLFRTRTGRDIALYLRGRKALATRADFGLGTLPELGSGGGVTGGALPEGSGLFPLSRTGTDPSPAQLLVAAGAPPSSPVPIWKTGLWILGAWLLGALSWILLLRFGTRLPRALRLLPTTGLPLLALWLLLGFQARSVAREGGEILRGDMVRTLALLKDGPDFLPMEVVPETAGFQVFRRGNGQILATTLSPGPLQAELLRIPLPPPSFPSLSTVEVGGSRVLFAVLREAPEQGLFLTTSLDSARESRVYLPMATVGGFASLLALVFLLGVPPVRGARVQG